MKFYASDKDQKGQANKYLWKLLNSGADVEVKRIPRNRTLKQNAYLHLILGAFASHFGYTLEEAKLLYKQMSPNIYKYEKNGYTFWRRSASLSTEEMSSTIDKLRAASEYNGYPLPLATDEGWLREIEKEIERNRYYTSFS